MKKTCSGQKGHPSTELPWASQPFLDFLTKHREPYVKQNVGSARREAKPGHPFSMEGSSNLFQALIQRGRRERVWKTRESERYPFYFSFTPFLSPRGPDFLLSGCLEQAKGHPLSGQNFSPCINTFALPAGSTWLRRDIQSAHKRYCHPWLEQKGSIFFNARLALVDLARRVILVCQRIEKST